MSAKFDLKYIFLTLRYFFFSLLEQYYGVIQIIRDTRRGGGVQRSVTPPFLHFETLFLMLLDGNLFVTKQDKASIDTLF